MDRRDSILVVDDKKTNRMALGFLLEADYTVREAANEEQAIDFLDDMGAAPAAVLLSADLPDSGGLRYAQQIVDRAGARNTPVIFVTGRDNPEAEARAFDMGAADILLRPYDVDVARRRIDNIVELYRHKSHLEELVAEQASRLRESSDALVDALSSVIEHRSLESGQHIRRIRMFTSVLLTEVARAYPEYHLEEHAIRVIVSAASMHDIGKIAIPDSILNKPGKLTGEEYEVMKTHTTRGCDILRTLGQTNDKEYLQYAYNICRYHHERWDGGGYPDGLKGDNIPICAQVAGVADVYDALTTSRVYKPAFSHEQAVNMILNGECGVFSSKLLECFKNVRGRFAELSRDYADGCASTADELSLHPRYTLDHVVPDTDQLGKLKYFTLLKYMDATVVEVDLDTEVYHLVHSPTGDFDRLRSDRLFGEAMREFVRGAVHPEDQETVLQMTPEDVRGSFAAGAMRRAGAYRIFSSETGAYYWVDCTVMRIDWQDPSINEALIIWRRADPPQGVPRLPDDPAVRFASLLCSGCLAIFYNNLTDNTYTVIKRPETMKESGLFPLYYSDAIRQQAETLVHPEDRAVFLHAYDLDAMRAYFPHNRRRVLRYRTREEDGGYRWVEATMLRVENMDGREGRPLLVYTLLMETDEQSTAVAGSRDALGAESVSAGTLADDGSRPIPAAVCRCRDDEELTIEEFSDGFLRLIGYGARDIRLLFCSKLAFLLHPDEREDRVRSLRRQLADGGEGETPCRVVRRDGAVRWLLLTGYAVAGTDGGRELYFVLLDVTASRNACDEYQRRLRLYEIVTDQTHDILLEWHVSADTISFSDNAEKELGYRPLAEEISRTILDKSHVYPEDRRLIIALMRRILEGESYVEAEFRLLRAGEYNWFRLRASAQTDGGGQPSSAVGVLMNIHSEKMLAHELRNKAERDSLTSLYNKSAASKLIDRYLADNGLESSAALLVLDIDDFKLINDSLGHLFGDAFLIEVARALREQCGHTDIIARIGGDEFLIFLPGLLHPGLAEQKAAQILAAFHTLLTRNEAYRQVSCSIGVAIAPRHGITYADLFRRADQALYQSKAGGKARYLVYESRLSDGAPAGLPRRVQTAANTKIDSDEEGRSLNSKLVEYVFRILYKSMDMEQAIQSILEIVGKQFDVSRVYIFENADDGPYGYNTFEWCNEGIKPEKDNLQHVSYEDAFGANYMNNFDEDGVFYCRDIAALPKLQVDILQPQGILSMLQCVVRDNGEMKGFVGFDDCRTARLWTQEQVDALTFIAEIISTFLLKERAKSRAVQSAAAMQNILDVQNAWIYVIRPTDHVMLYVNRRTVELVPHARPGQRCYTAFFGRDEPCEQCPVRRLGADCSNFTMEIRNEGLGVWTDADASLVSWKGEEAYLLSCHDITKYKEPADA